MRKLLNKIIVSRNRTSSIGVGGEQSVALCLNLNKKGHWTWQVKKKIDKPGVQDLVKIAHSEEMDGEVGWGQRCWQRRKGLCVSHPAPGVIH